MIVLSRNAFLDRSWRSLRDLEVFRGGLAAIFHEVIFDNLIFVEGREPGALDRGDMDEHVLVSLHRLDEPITLGRVEPLDGAFLHRLSPGLDVKKTRSRYDACHATNGLPEVCSISWSKRTVERPRSDCAWDCNTKFAR